VSSTVSGIKPQATDVIRYSYLWRHEAVRGEESGRKDRPCLVLAATETKAGLRVITAPITTKHHDPRQLVIPPPKVARHLGLEPGCGVVCNDLNRFLWVGLDVRPGADGTPFHGQIPARLYEEILRRVLANRVPETDRA
jgi:hypothetical protein